MDYFKFLPQEITLDILTRLPTEFVFDCKSVCRNWRSVVGHPSFSKIHCNRHLNHPASESGKLGFLALTSRRDGLHYFEYDDENHHQRIRRILFTLPIDDPRFRFVGSINGLICLRDYKRSPSVYIYNPITRECVTLPEIKIDGDIEYGNISFGYVSSTNEYKIVRFYKLETHLEIYIYTLGSGKGWRYLGELNYGSKSLHLAHSVFFANGALYRLDYESQMIGTFDLAEEKFGEHLALPPLPPDNHWNYFNLLGVLDGFLVYYIVYLGDVEFMDIWVLKKKNHNHDKGVGDQPLGWSKEFTIEGAVLKEHLLAVTKSSGVLSSRDWDINIYDTNTSTSKSLVEFNSHILDVFPHKNTLVSLKKLGEEDAKVVESAEI